MSAFPSQVVAPLAAMGATWAVRKAMSSAYARRTGHLPPQADDMEVSLGKVLLWSVATAAVSVTVEVVIIRVVSRFSDTQVLASFKEQDAITG